MIRSPASSSPRNSSPSSGRSGGSAGLTKNSPDCPTTCRTCSLDTRCFRAPAVHASPTYSTSPLCPTQVRLSITRRLEGPPARPARSGRREGRPACRRASVAGSKPASASSAAELDADDPRTAVLHRRRPGTTGPHWAGPAAWPARRRTTRRARRRDGPARRTPDAAARLVHVRTGRPSARA